MSCECFCILIFIFCLSIPISNFFENIKQNIDFNSFKQISCIKEFEIIDNNERIVSLGRKIYQFKSIINIYYFEIRLYQLNFGNEYISYYNMEDFCGLVKD